MTPLIRFKCQNCGEPLRADRAQAGKMAQCIKCRAFMVVPQADSRYINLDDLDGLEPAGSVAPVNKEARYGSPKPPESSGSDFEQLISNTPPLPKSYRLLFPLLGTGLGITALLAVFLWLVTRPAETPADLKQASARQPVSLAQSHSSSTPRPQRSKETISSTPSKETSTKAPEIAATAPTVGQGTPASPTAKAQSSSPAKSATPPSVTANASSNLTTEQIVAITEKSVGLIRGKMSFGTGFVARPGILATNAHVIGLDFSERLTVRFPSAPEDSQGPIKLRVLYLDNKRDIALVGADTDLPALTLATGYEFKRGQDVTVIGNPGMGREGPLENAVSRGIMSSQAVLNGLHYYQLSIAINPGNSGGPVFDPSARVIGIATLKAMNKEGLAFCIPVDELQNALVIVDGQTPEDVTKMSALHRARVTFELLSQTTGVYEAGLDQYVTAMQIALLNNISANAGLEAAEKAISKKVAELDKVLAEDLQPNLTDLRDDKLVEQSVRARLRDLWTTYKEMKSHFDNPRGTYDTYRARAESLREKRRRLVDALKKTLGIEGQE